MKKEDRAGWERMRRNADQRWVDACGMFSKVDELHSDIVRYLPIVIQDENTLDEIGEDEEGEESEEEDE